MFPEDPTTSDFSSGSMGPRRASGFIPVKDNRSAPLTTPRSMITFKTVLLSSLSLVTNISFAASKIAAHRGRCQLMPVDLCLFDLEFQSGHAPDANLGARRNRRRRD